MGEGRDRESGLCFTSRAPALNRTSSNLPSGTASPHAPWDTLCEARAPFRVVAGTQRCRMGVRAVFYCSSTWTATLQESNNSRGPYRFVKHIGQGRKREPPREQAKKGAWGGSCFDFGGQLAAHQSRRGNRNDACRRSAFGPLYDYVPPFRCAWAYRGG